MNMNNLKFFVLFFMPMILSSTFVQANEMYGMFMVVKGEISVLSAQNRKRPVKVGSKILSGETVVSGIDSRAKIVMSDRNVINISPETQLKIEQYKNDPKTGEKNVELNLIDGKVRNNVEQKYDGEKNKFIMKTATAVAGVRGTQFFVAFSSKTQITQVVTLKGQVSFAPVSVSGTVGSSVFVNKGESTSVGAGAPAPEPPQVLPKEELKKVDKESTAASNSPPKEAAPAANADAAASQASDKKTEGDQPRDGSKTSGPNTDGLSNPNADGFSNPNAGNNPPQEGASQDGQRSPAAVRGSESPASPPPGSRMVDRRDMDIGLAKEIKSPVMAPASPTVKPGMLMPQPLAPPKPPPALGDIIKNYNGTTKVIIVPN
ncbi:MAG: FecR domain-containing protein [Pseudobdellovibrionaceae bacterium]